MSITIRAFLAIAALLSGSYFIFLAVGLSQGSIATPVIIAVATVLVAPLWVPAIIPARYRTVLRGCRWVGAFFLSISVIYFAASGFHDLGRSKTAPESFTPEEGVIQLVLAAFAVFFVIVLISPDIQTSGKSTSEKER